MPKCDFNKVAFPRNTSGWLVLEFQKHFLRHYCWLFLKEDTFVIIHDVLKDYEHR